MRCTKLDHLPTVVNGYGLKYAGRCECPVCTEKRAERIDWLENKARELRRAIAEKKANEAV